MFLFDVVSATVDKTMIASFESGEEIKGTEFFKSKDDIMRCFPLKVAPARPLFQDRIETLCLKEVRSFREENFPLIHPEVRLKNQNRNAANKKVRSAIMQRRQQRLSDLSTGTGNTNKTSSSQHAENSTTAVLSDDQRSQQAMSIFTGAVIHGGQFSNSINSLNQSLKLALQEAKVESSPKRYKRLKVLDSDFD